MTEPITTDPTGDIGRVRLRIGDTIEGKGVFPDNRNFLDAEITALIVDEDNSWQRACAAAFEVLAASWADVPDIKIGPRTESSSKVALRYQSLAMRFRTQYGGVAGAGTAFSVAFKRDDGYVTDA